MSLILAATDTAPGDLKRLPLTVFGERYEADGRAESGGAVVDQVGPPGLGARPGLCRLLGRRLRRGVLRVEPGPARRRGGGGLGDHAAVHGDVRLRASDVAGEGE